MLWCRDYGSTYPWISGPTQRKWGETYRSGRDTDCDGKQEWVDVEQVGKRSARSWSKEPEDDEVPLISYK